MVTLLGYNIWWSELLRYYLVMYKAITQSYRY
jgi:hypothetical protein